MERTSARAPKAKEKAPSSTAAVQIVQEAIKEGVSIADLAKLAKGDPAFAMRVLSVVNSAAFARRQSIKDVDQAMSMLGVRGVRNVALGLVVSDLAPMNEAGSLLLGHSLRRAMASRAIAQALGERDLDSYFTAGLLLESGLLVHLRDEEEIVGDIAKLPWNVRPVNEVASDLEPHPETGARLAQEYGLPEATSEAIRHSHDEEPPEDSLSKVCWLAERVAGVFEGSIVEQARQAAIEAAQPLGLSEAAIDKILEELPAAVSDAASGFKRDLGPQVDLEQLRADANAQLVDMNQQLEDMVRTLKRLVSEKEELTLQLKIANDALSKQAATDELTQLPNRRALEDALSRDLARSTRENTALSFIVADVDHFKKFNDTHGHQTGDEVLKVVSKVLADTVRAGDVPARFGGEEFCVILPKTDGEGAMIVGERLRAAIEGAEVPSDAGPLKVTASFGIATIDPGQQETKEALFARADQALYGAKEAGRNRVIAAS